MLQKIALEQFKMLLSSILQCYSPVQPFHLTATDFLTNFSASLFKALVTDITVDYIQVNKWFINT